MNRFKIISILCAAAAIASPSAHAVNIGTVNTDVTINNTDFTRTPSSAGNITSTPGASQAGGSYTFSYGGFSGVATVASGSQASPSFSLSITNTTGSPITSITLSGFVAMLKANSTPSTLETLTASVSGISGFTVSSATAGGVAANSLNINTLTGSGAPVTGAYSATISGFTLASGSSFTITWTDSNSSNTDAMFGLANMKVRANVAGNNSAITATPATVNFNRVMVGSTNPTNNVTINKTGSDTTTYTVNASGNASVSGAGTSFAANAQSDQINVGIDRSTVGVKSGTVTVDNTAANSAAAGQGSADTNDTISVSGTVVANRVVTSSTASLGKVLVGATTDSQSIALGTSGSDDTNTRVTVNGTQASNGGVTVAAGSNALFNDAADTATRNVSGNFSTSGTKSVNVSLSVTGEGLTGESAVSPTVTATADVYQAAALVVNTSETLDDGGVATVNNAVTSDGGQRAEARIVSRAVSDDWTVQGLDTNTVLGANGVNSSGTVGFNSTGKLNGTHVGSLVIGLEHADQTIQGTSTNDLGTRTWNLSHIVSGNTGTTGSAVVGAGQSYSGFNLKNSQGKGTESGFATNGDATVVGETVINMSFSETSGANNDEDRISDVVNLTGTDDEIIVLTLTYDPADLSLGGYESEEQLKVGWLDEGTNLWTVATAGNSGSNASGDQRGFIGSFESFQSIYGTDLSQYVGAYGVDIDGDKAWAVINHNSEFAIIPEPGAAALLTVTGVAFVIFRRRLRRAW